MALLKTEQFINGIDLADCRARRARLRRSLSRTPNPGRARRALRLMPILHRTAVTAMLMLCGNIGTVQAVCSGEAHKSLQSAMKIEQEWPLRPNQDTATRYLQRLGEQLLPPHAPDFEQLANYDWPSDRWYFSIVRDLSVNAFSIGNGRIYLTDGSINFVNSEAELAAILAHEIAHQLAGHFCPSNQSPYGGARQIGSLTQIMDNSKEMQADYVALRILRDAGFPTHAMFEVVKRLPLTGDVRQQYQRLEALRNHLPAFNDLAGFSSSSEFITIKESLRQ